MVGRSTSCQRLIFLTMAPRYCQSVKLPFQSYFTCAVHELMHPNKPENSKCREAVFISDFRFSACLPGLMVLRRRMWTAEQKANIAPPTVFHRLVGGVIIEHAKLRQPRRSCQLLLKPPRRRSLAGLKLSSVRW